MRRPFDLNKVWLRELKLFLLGIQCAHAMSLVGYYSPTDNSLEWLSKPTKGIYVLRHPLQRILTLI